MSEQQPVFDSVSSESHHPRISRRTVLRAATVAGVLALPPASVTIWETALRDPVLRNVSPQLRKIAPSWSDHPNMPPMEWASFAGDPEATNDQSTWRTIGVVTMPKTALLDLMNVPESNGRTLLALHQIGQNRGRSTPVGSWQNLRWFDHDGEMHVGVGFKIGPDTLNATFAVTDTSGELVPARFVSPYNPPEPFTMDSLPHDLPNVPVLSR